MTGISHVQGSQFIFWEALCVKMHDFCVNTIPDVIKYDGTCTSVTFNKPSYNVQKLALWWSSDIPYLCISILIVSLLSGYISIFQPSLCYWNI